MILASFLAIPLVCGFLGWLLGRRSELASRAATLIGSLACLVLAGALWLGAAFPSRL